MKTLSLGLTVNFSSKIKKVLKKSKTFIAELTFIFQFFGLLKQSCKTWIFLVELHGKNELRYVSIHF